MYVYLLNNIFFSRCLILAGKGTQVKHSVFELLRLLQGTRRDSFFIGIWFFPKTI